MPTRPMTHRRLMDARNPRPKPRDARVLTRTQRLYDARFYRAREPFLRRNPLCLYCLRQGRKTAVYGCGTLGVVDHNPPHKGDPAKFWDTASWTPCCKSCHDYVTPAFDGGHGNPIRPREGVYVAPKPGEVTL